MRRLVITLFLILGLLPGLLLGQGSLGTITGSVLDASGAYVPGAAITITSIEMGVATTAKTSSAGYYRIAVPPGTYRISVVKQGFQTGIISNVLVSVVQVVTANVTLQVGSTKQTVTVTGQTSLLTPDTAEVGASITPQEFQALPIQVDDGGRDIETFVWSSLPGAVGNSYQGSINGGQQFSSNIVIDGISVARYDMSGGSLSEFSPTADSIGEFKVQMANYSAEYDNTGGGIINFAMKSGTNQFHGSVFEYLQNPIFNAAGLTANAFGLGKDNTRQNDFGGAFGGPIKKDRTFFFATYEGNRFRNFNYSRTMTLPTAAMKKGDFSAWLGGQLGADALGRPVFKNEIYNPTTTRMVPAGAVDPVTGLQNNSGSAATIRDPFDFNGQLNVINPGEFGKASSVLTAMLPDPEFSGLIRNSPGMGPRIPQLRQDTWSVKIDHIINDKQRITGSFTQDYRSRWHRNGNAYPPFPDQPLNPWKTQLDGGPQARFSYSWTINDHTVNELALGYNRFGNINNVTDNKKYTPQLGIPGIPDACFPTFFFKGHVGSLSSPLGVACNNNDPSESYIYKDALNYVRGKHSLKFGGEYLHYRYNTYEPGTLSGAFTFTDRETSLPGFTSKTGHPFASFLLGAVNGGNMAVYHTEPGYRAGVFGFFLQDDFKASSRLTLNLGIRWDIPLPKTEAFNRQSGFDPTAPNPGADNIPGALVFLGSCPTCIHGTSFQDDYFKEVAPRFGLAYQITKNLVFRGGYGISYSPPNLNNFGSQNTSGFNSSVPLNAGTSPTGFPADPVIYLSPLVGASLPAAAQIGVPPFTGTLPNRDPASFNGNSLDFLPRSLAQPYTQNWSAGFQLLLPSNVLLEANYMGSKGTRLLDSNFSNFFDQPPSKYMGLGDILNDDLATDLANPATAAILAQYGITKLPYPDFENNNWSTLVAAAVAPFPQYSGLTNNYPTMGSSTYHSLQVLARKDSAHGLTFIAAYTLSKTLTNSDTALYYPSLVQDFYNRKLEKSIAAFDYPQNLKLTWIYTLPFGPGHRWLNSNKGLARLASGWQITALQNYYSGDPLAISSPFTTGISNPGLRPDLLSGVPETFPLKGLDVVNGTPYLNPAAFPEPPLSPINSFALRVGTAPRFLPNIRGPGHESENIGITKNTLITEQTIIQFRVEMFNAFNRTGRGDPDTSLGDGLPSQGGTFGLITGPMNGPRLIQLSLRLNF
ncbi:MAG: TonB-dependent receptor domain-containing protein [Terriglobia bacterium]